MNDANIKFIIIGAQKCGTSALYHDLCKHPQISPAVRKEVHYFDSAHYPDHEWYRDKFPNNKMTGEASPVYLFLPFVPKRMRQFFDDDIRFIIMLRDPVKRAFSHYNMEKHDGMSFEDIIESNKTLEVENILSEMNQWEESNFNVSKITELLRWSYLARGRYFEQIKRWFDIFPRENFMILESDDYLLNTKDSLKKVQEHIGLSPDGYSGSIQHIGVYHKKISDKTKESLRDYYREENEKLYGLLGRRLWNW